jgi:hypothetical protein
MYRGHLLSTRATSPQVDSRFTGEVRVNGRAVSVEAAPGMLGHSWGRARGEAWAWAHCNTFPISNRLIIG